MIFFDTPKFWYKTPGFWTKVFLKPISVVYDFFARRNYKQPYKYKSNVEVIAVGALTVGGAGKTVVVKSLCELLQKEGKKIAILSRGYGSTSDECIKVDANRFSFQQVGDEPLLLAQNFPVFVCKDRAKSAQLAEKEGFNCLILDDGIMQRYLEPTKRLIVIDDQQRIGNGELFPLGPNRLSVDIATAEASAVIILGKTVEQDRNWLKIDNALPIVRGQIQSDFSCIQKSIIAFCGIGYPEKFFNSLSNFEVVAKIAFPDHFPFSNEDIERLIQKAKHVHAQLVTTEKDLMRIPKKYRPYVHSIPIKINWENEKQLMNLLRSKFIELVASDNQRF